MHFLLYETESIGDKGDRYGILIGVEIGNGIILPQLALLELFVINIQNGFDFISVRLGLSEAKI